MKYSDPNQLSLFEIREERAAIVEYDGQLNRSIAERIAGIVRPYRGPLPYLLDLIEDKEPLIHLFGQNPIICLVQSLAGGEPEESKQAWVERGAAGRHPEKAGYRRHGNLTTELNNQQSKAEIWHLEKGR